MRSGAGNDPTASFWLGQNDRLSRYNWSRDRRVSLSSYLQSSHYFSLPIFRDVADGDALQEAHPRSFGGTGPAPQAVVPGGRERGSTGAVLPSFAVRARQVGHISTETLGLGGAGRALAPASSSSSYSLYETGPNRSPKGEAGWDGRGTGSPTPTSKPDRLSHHLFPCPVPPYSRFRRVGDASRVRVGAVAGVCLWHDCVTPTPCSPFFPLRWYSGNGRCGTMR